MEREIVETNVSVNIANLAELLKDPLFSQVRKDAQGKEIVLFLGVTGAGKSTCISYLMGAKLVRGTAIGGDTIAKLDENLEKVTADQFPEIGLANFRSCTLYTRIFKDPILEQDPLLANVVYADTAGFLDTRDIVHEPQVCSSFSMQYAIQSAESVRAIVLVFEWSIFLKRISLEIEAVAQILTKLLVDPEINVGSIIFLINKVPENRTKEHFAFAVSDYKAVLIDQAEKMQNIYSDGSLELNRVEAVVRIVKLLDEQIRKKPENVVLMDVFDEGETRKKIHTLLRGKKLLITKEQFNFRGYNKKRDIFDSQIGIIAPLMKEYEAQKREEEILSEESNSHTIEVNSTGVDGAEIIDALKDEKTLEISSESIEKKPENLLTVKAEIVSDECNHLKGAESQNTTKPNAALTSNNDQKTISSIVLELVDAAEPIPIEIPIVKPSKNSEIKNNKQTLNLKRIVSEFLNPHYILRALMGMGGISLGLFGLFLLMGGVATFLHWSLMTSIVQKIFHMALAESTACAFVYGITSIIFCGAIFYFRSKVCLGDERKESINDLEDVNDEKNIHVSIDSQEGQVNKKSNNFSSVTQETNHYMHEENENKKIFLF